MKQTYLSPELVTVQFTATEAVASRRGNDALEESVNDWFIEETYED